MLIFKQDKGLDISIWHKHNKSVFYMLIKALGVYNNHKLLNKPEPESIINSKQKTLSLLKNMSKLIPKENAED